MERERVEIAQELLLKAHVMANHTTASRRSPLRNRPPSASSSIPPSVGGNTSMRVQDLHPADSISKDSIQELELLHREAMGQLKDVSNQIIAVVCIYFSLLKISFRMDKTEAKLSNIDMQSSTVGL